MTIPPQQPKPDHNRYDTVFKNLSRPLLPYVLTQILDLPKLPPNLKYKALKNELLKPRQRRVDGFYLIELPNIPKFILHLEFQSTPDSKMIYRVAEYHGMGLRQYELPIRHVVVYLGKGAPRMRTQLTTEEVFTGFTLLDLNELDTSSLLGSEEPAELILACLGDYGDLSSQVVLESIVSRLQGLLAGADLHTYLGYLQDLVGLRGSDRLLTKIIESMQINLDYDYKTHHLYKEGVKAGIYEGRQEGRQKGRQEGRQKGRQESIRQGALNLRKRGMSFKDIASIFNISVAEVKAILTDNSSKV